MQNGETKHPVYRRQCIRFYSCRDSPLRALRAFKGPNRCVGGRVSEGERTDSRDNVNFVWYLRFSPFPRVPLTEQAVPFAFTWAVANTQVAARRKFQTRQEIVESWDNTTKKSVSKGTVAARIRATAPVG